MPDTKVRISYTLDLEEVPEKAKIVLRDAISKLQLSLTVLSKLERDTMTVETAHSAINCLEQHMNIINNSQILLADYSNILRGYLQYKTDQLINNDKQTMPILNESTEEPRQ